MIDLFFLDQSGFAPTLPTGYSWGRLGTRLVVPYEAPQGRRVNAVGALAPYDPAGPRLVFETRRTAEGRYDAAAHLAFVRRVAALAEDPATEAARVRPCVIALDNYSVHHAAAVKEMMPALAAVGVDFFYLPAYSPELNPIEPIWRQVKYQDIPERSHPTDTALQLAVETALAHRDRSLRESTHNLPRPA
jgi:transposase